MGFGEDDCILCRYIKAVHGEVCIDCVARVGLDYGATRINFSFMWMGECPVCEKEGLLITGAGPNTNDLLVCGNHAPEDEEAGPA